MFERKKLYINWNNKLYYVQRIIKETLNPIISVWKEHLNSDIVAKRSGWIYFLEEIKEPEILEFIPNVKEEIKEVGEVK